MAQAPWYKRFAADFESDPYVQAMNAIERCWYSEMIDKMWIHTPHGYLPNDKQLLAKMLAKAPACFDFAFEDHCEIVLARFKTTQDGLWLYHSKVMEQVEKVSQTSQKRADAGRKGGKAKAKQVLNKSVASVKQMPIDVDTDVDVDVDVKTPHSPPFDSEQAVDRIYRHYPKVMEEPRSKSAITQALIELSAQMGSDEEAVVYLETMTQKYRLLVAPFKNIPELWDQVPKPWKWFESKKYNDDAGTWMPVGAQDGKGRDERESRNGNSVRAKQNRSFDAIGAALKRKLGEREPDAGGTEVTVPEPRDHGRGSGVVIDAVGPPIPAVRPAAGADSNAAHPRDQQVLSQRGRGAGGD